MGEGNGAGGRAGGASVLPGGPAVALAVPASASPRLPLPAPPPAAPALVAQGRGKPRGQGPLGRSRVGADNGRREGGKGLPGRVPRALGGLFQGPDTPRSAEGAGRPAGRGGSGSVPLKASGTPGPEGAGLRQVSAPPDLRVRGVWFLGEGAAVIGVPDLGREPGLGGDGGEAEARGFSLPF